MTNELVKLVYAASVARGLLKLGYQIVDIKPNKENTDRTVFIFKDIPGLKDDLRRLTT